MQKLILLLSGIFLIIANIQSQNLEYTIMRGDKIDIMVMQHPEFSVGGITVLPDGVIQYPGIGSIKAAGMTSAQLTDSLTLTLNKYVVNPIVTVFVRNIEEQSLNIFGFVNKPGQYQVFDTLDLFTAIGRAGGIKNFKKVRFVYILRKNQTIEKYKINRFYSHNNLSMPLPMVYAGDTIYVKEPLVVNWSALSFTTSFLTLVIAIIGMAT